jgi:hypothetical protein
MQYYCTNLTFRGPCIVMYCYNKTNKMHQLLKSTFETELSMLQTVSLSITRSLALYTQQQVYVIQVRLTACMTYTCCCVYSWWWTEKLSEACRVLFQKWIWEVGASCWFCYKNYFTTLVSWNFNKEIIYVVISQNIII